VTRDKETSPTKSGKTRLKAAIKGRLLKDKKYKKKKKKNTNRNYNPVPAEDTGGFR